MIYNHLASIYDDIMSHVPYAKWAEYIHQILMHFNSPAGRTLDAACGTGSLLAHFAPGCSEATGFDSSPNMIEIARERFSRSKLPVNFAVADLLQWQGQCDYDLALCLYDSINYMMNHTALIQALSNLTDSLKPAGMLVFDISTINNAQHNFHGLREKEVINGVAYTRRASWDGDNRILHNDFTLRETGGEQIVEERHSQRLYTIREVKTAIDSAGLECLAVLDEFTFRNGNEQSERIHFVARKGD